MRKGSMIVGGIVAAAFLMGSCASHYHLTGVERTRILVDKRYDAAVDPQVASFMQPYKHQVDSMMSPVVGRSARYLAAFRPESPLSNLLSDILVWSGSAFGEKPDFGVYNMGGIRAAFAEGDITVGDVIDVAPFENKICFLTLKGSDVIELCGQMAVRGGEGVSHAVQMVIGTNGSLQSLKLNGAEVDPQASYRIATIDYLAQGNDGMMAFKKGTNLVAPEGEANNLRFIIMNYLRSQLAEGKAVDAAVEGRVKVLK